MHKMMILCHHFDKNYMFYSSFIIFYFNASEYQLNPYVYDLNSHF